MKLQEERQEQLNDIFETLTSLQEEISKVSARVAEVSESYKETILALREDLEKVEDTVVKFNPVIHRHRYHEGFDEAALNDVMDTYTSGSLGLKETQLFVVLAEKYNVNPSTIRSVLLDTGVKTEKTRYNK